MKSKLLTVKYKNWKGKEDIRHILPEKIWFGRTQWHDEEQWFLRATDMDKDKIRDFALKDILEVISND